MYVLCSVKSIIIHYIAAVPLYIPVQHDECNAIVIQFVILCVHDSSLSDNENLIFRGNTFATKAVDTYMKMVGDAVSMYMYVHVHYVCSLAH